MRLFFACLFLLFAFYHFSHGYQQCSSAHPYLCKNGTCANSVESCENSCTSVICSTGACRPNFYGCYSTCAYNLTVCWDGSCAKNLRECPSVQACPVGTMACGDGTCATGLVSSCTLTPCPALAPKEPYGCAAGGCDASGCGPYEGCAAGFFRCQDGSCVLNSSNCTSCTDSKGRIGELCFDGSCSLQACSNPPLTIKPIPFCITINATVSTGFTSLANSYTPLANVSFSSNSITTIPKQANFTHNCTTPMLCVSGVSNFDLMKSFSDSWTSSQAERAILSSVLRFEFGCAQDSFSNSVNLTFSLFTSANETLQDYCVATLDPQTLKWTCQNVTISTQEDDFGNKLIQASVTHFSSWAVIQHTATNTPTENANNLESSQLPIALVIGCVVGCIVLALLVILIAVFFARRASKQRKRDENEIETLKKIVGTKIETTELVGVNIGEKLGEGNFGAVYKGSYSETPVALKKLHSKDPKVQEEFKKEMAVLQQLRHPNVVRFYGLFRSDDGSQFMVTEFINLGSLHGFLREKKFKIPLYSLVGMMCNGAAGLSHLHDKNILHRDMAARNLLIEHREQVGYCVKVADFGLAVSDKEASVDSKSLIPIRWSPPEVLTNTGKRQFTKACDVYSFSVTCWEIIAFGEVPFLGLSNETVVAEVRKGNRPQEIPDTPKELWEIICAGWRQEAEQRLVIKAMFSELNSIVGKMPTTLTGSQLNQLKASIPKDEMVNEVGASEYEENVNIVTDNYVDPDGIDFQQNYN